MRDTCPFVLDVLIFGKGRAEILIVQIIIDLTHPFSCQYTAIFDFLVGQHFKFCKHGLTEQGRAEFFNIVVYQVFTHFQVGFRLEQMLHEQGLIDRGSYFCSKNGVVAIGKRLGFTSVVRMHGMAHFMHDGKYVFQAVGVV